MLKERAAKILLENGFTLHQVLEVLGIDKPQIVPNPYPYFPNPITQPAIPLEQITVTWGEVPIMQSVIGTTKLQDCKIESA